MRAIATLLCLLPFAAEARDRLHERDNWIVEHVPADSPASSPFCLALILAKDRLGRSLSLAVFGDGSAILSASGLDGEASGPSTVLSVLKIDGTRWGLDWEAGEVADYAEIKKRARAELPGQAARGRVRGDAHRSAGQGARRLPAGRGRSGSRCSA